VAEYPADTGTVANASARNFALCLLHFLIDLRGLLRYPRTIPARREMVFI